MEETHSCLSPQQAVQSKEVSIQGKIQQNPAKTTRPRNRQERTSDKEIIRHRLEIIMFKSSTSSMKIVKQVRNYKEWPIRLDKEIK